MNGQEDLRLVLSLVAIMVSGVMLWTVIRAARFAGRLDDEMNEPHGPGPDWRWGLWEVAGFAFVVVILFIAARWFPLDLVTRSTLVLGGILLAAHGFWRIGNGFAFNLRASAAYRDHRARAAAEALRAATDASHAASEASKTAEAASDAAAEASRTATVEAEAAKRALNKEEETP